jgi:uncharacterized protein (DUF1015 family)
VPRFEPFSALRYAAPFSLESVTAPPYDVLSVDDVQRLAGQHPYNIVHIDVPQESQGPNRYELAADMLNTWRHDEVMVLDPRPSFTLYRMAFTDEAGRQRETVGVLGALEVVDEGAGGVLPHERTTPKAKSDRLDLTRATGANLSPVWGLSLASELTELLRAPGELMGSTTDAHGVVHTIERIDDPERCAAITQRVASAPVVIADGHHRYAISRTWRDEVRAATGRHDTEAELTLTYLGELVAEQLNVAAIHRLYHEVAYEVIRSALARSFDLVDGEAVSPATLIEMEQRGALCLVDSQGRATWMTPRDDAFTGVRDLDSARLEHALADVAHEVTYQHGVHEVLHELSTGTYCAAVLIRPVSIGEIQRTAHEGLLMPPKSTFFTPKLLTGLVVRPVAV